jgi:hypothetical protein
LFWNCSRTLSPVLAHQIQAKTIIRSINNKIIYFLNLASKEPPPPALAVLGNWINWPYPVIGIDVSSLLENCCMQPVFLYWILRFSLKNTTSFNAFDPSLPTLTVKLLPKGALISIISVVWYPISYYSIRPVLSPWTA